MGLTTGSDLSLTFLQRLQRHIGFQPEEAADAGELDAGVDLQVLVEEHQKLLHGEAIEVALQLLKI